MDTRVLTGIKHTDSKRTLKRKSADVARDKERRTKRAAQVVCIANNR